VSTLLQLLQMDHSSHGVGPLMFLQQEVLDNHQIGVLWLVPCHHIYVWIWISFVELLFPWLPLSLLHASKSTSLSNELTISSIHGNLAYSHYRDILSRTVSPLVFISP
jgi:hypothetical protein